MPTSPSSPPSSARAAATWSMWGTPSSRSGARRCGSSGMPRWPAAPPSPSNAASRSWPRGGRSASGRRCAVGSGFTPERWWRPTSAVPTSPTTRCWGTRCPSARGSRPPTSATGRRCWPRRRRCARPARASSSAPWTPWTWGPARRRCTSSSQKKARCPRRCGRCWWGGRRHGCATWPGTSLVFFQRFSAVDKPSATYADWCRRYLVHPPPPAWNGQGEPAGAGVPTAAARGE